ncbi:HAD-IA family hydrolase [Massilia sp. CFBP9012]|uniref:HAD family hydrolase n=1 Tax=Massilia sp. CFBP9012 TaxID=3096531 RepID=UPI002A69E9D9|nr:HAD-IA family hydrolase [Massilia sp. CFBP9012]MDY0975105.1 HAD-IA family hydrolase [Massilia sp. CFBP9012]
MTTPARALIFDMDGTIVDNMDFHTQAWITFFARRGKVIEPDAFFRDTAGRQGKEILRHYMGEELSDDELATLNHEKEELYRELYGPHRATLPGFDAFIAAGAARGWKLAVATSASPGSTRFILDEMDLRSRFDAVVVGTVDVPRGKPHPDVFLKAADRCETMPAQCIVFEDAPLGVEAARRAGMRAVVLTTTLPAEAFAEFDNVIAIVNDFTQLDVETLLA